MYRGAWRVTVHRVTKSQTTEATEHACMESRTMAQMNLFAGPE